MLGLWPLLCFPEFLALMPFQDLCRREDNTFICKSSHLQVFWSLLRGRTTTFSQLSHDGRTAVERDKNARKIVA